jgi:aryl-alcohol dehydrogenase (NADP+)
MDHVRFGTTGLKVSRLCLGCMTYGDPAWRPWVLPEGESLPFLRRAFDAGINFFDTADMYSLGTSEEILGRAVKEHGGRDRLVLATKVYHPMSEDPNDRGLSRKHIMASIDDSLRRLGTDYIDLYIIHRFDRETPIEESLEALDELVRAGKVRYLGASSMYAYQFARMRAFQQANGLATFVSMQNHLNLLYREEEREMLPYCREEGVAVTPWSPLARGLLARAPAEKTARAGSDAQAPHWYAREDENRAIITAVHDIAGERGVSAAQVAMAWVMQVPGVTVPIVGASKPHHLDDAIAALDLKLSEEESLRLTAAYRPREVAGH